ncbi:hypothetical protein [Kocuria sp.]|uniref:hypothetical protein n=1 Tax=Kocuria sp. TaxID=1871328 RepID=UPI0026E0B219|nr:hypothetical protein [Kocuria sp.]MDO5618700.1 hypothetical protein [Kocuria sp.]
MRETCGVLAWPLTVIAVLVLVIGLYFQSTWWMLSTPVALGGAITAGLSHRYVAMAISIAVIAVLFAVMLVFAP